jgi:hypothetical protein
MENSTKFDLNQAIHRWREDLLASPAFRSEDVEELQDHLQENMRTLQRNGLSEQEAFWVARNRLGETDALHQEFGRRNKRAIWLDRVLWMVVGSLGINALGSLVSSLATVTTLGVLQMGDTGRILGPIILCAHVLGWMVLLTLAYRAGQGQDRWLDGIARWVSTHPLQSGLCIFGFLLLTRLGTGGVSALLARSMTPSAFGTLSMWQSSAYLIHILLWPAILGWLLHQRRGHTRNSCTI